ncbi:hypothetical protein [uncultured Microbacterium sp.]|uniref:hypothetical protein n=1 Tax=uncultured Microbacterium sp. TaxID=191216 RepID=UPI0028D3294C|nr:hypothetical protein [uncultured Microbacterium sp.]
MYPVSASSAQVGGPDGHSYGGVILPERDAALPGLLDSLAGIRFSGWIAPSQDGWTVVLGDPGAGVVADARRGIIEVGALLAARVPGPVLAVRVREDRQLALVAWRSAEEVARYCSDPSREPGADREVLSEPVGAEYAGAFAQLWDRPDAVDELAELLEEELDPDSVYESERLGTLLRVLGLPGWIVAAGSLPRSMPRGPSSAELTRLRAGLTGMGGRSRDALVRRLRRRQNPPPVIDEPPTGGAAGLEPWMF